MALVAAVISTKVQIGVSARLNGRRKRRDPAHETAPHRTSPVQWRDATACVVPHAKRAGITRYQLDAAYFREPSFQIPTSRRGDYRLVWYPARSRFSQLFDHAYQTPFDHRLYQREDICFKRSARHIVFFEHRLANVSQAFSSRQKLPGPRAHRIKPKISAAGEI